MDPVDPPLARPRERLDQGPNSGSHSESRASNLRRVVLSLSAVLTAVGLFWIGRAFVIDGKLHFGNPTLHPSLLQDSSDPQPRQVRAEVTRVSGAQVVRPGDKCEFLIERRLRQRSPYWCHAQVVCGGRLLFGGPEGGYFTCRLFDDERRDVVGSDPSSSAADRDAALLINSREGVMRIWDDAHGSLGEFSVEAEILSIQ